MAWLLRYRSWLLTNIRSKSKKKELRTGELTTEEVSEAESLIVKPVENESFHEEPVILQSPQKSIKRSSSLSRLDPVIISGVIGVGDRLSNAPYSSYEAKHQIILPKQHHVSDLIIGYYHQRYAHFDQKYILVCT